MLKIMPLDLNRMFEEGRDRLRRLQRADAKTKKRYLVFASALAMVLVILIWFFYLSLTLPKVASTSPEVALPATSGEKSDSFLEIIGRGAKNFKDGVVREFKGFKDGVSQGISSFANRLRETREFTIEP